MGTSGWELRQGRQPATWWRGALCRRWWAISGPFCSNWWPPCHPARPSRAPVARVPCPPRTVGRPAVGEGAGAGAVQQVWAVLIISQSVQAVRLEVAGRAGVDPFEVPLPVLVQELPWWMGDRRAADLLAPIGRDGRRIGFIRPSRRTQLPVPAIPGEVIVTPPRGPVLHRTPRDAARRRPATANALNSLGDMPSWRPAPPIVE